MAEFIISKIKLPDDPNVYKVKDSDAQLMLAGFDKVSGSVKAYIDQIADLAFDVVVLETLPEASESTYNTYKNNIVLIPDTQSKETGAYIENIIIRTGTQGSYAYAWEPIGTTQIDLSGYVTSVAYANGTLTQTKGDGTTTNVHTFGALADKSTVAVQYDKATGGSVTYDAFSTATFTGIEGNISVGVDSESQYTDIITNVEGTTLYYVLNTTGEEDSEGQITNSYKTEVVPSYTPTKETVTVTATGGSNGTSATVSASFLNPGSLPSFKEGTFSQGSLPSLTAASTATFAQSGLGATVGTTGDDAETLIFSFAPTATAVTDRGTFDAGSLPNKAADTWSAGSLPTLDLSAFDGGTPTTLPTAYATSEVVTDITGATAVEVLNNVSIDDGDNSEYDIAMIETISTGSTNTLVGTFTPEGTITIETTPTTTTSVTISTTPTSATVNIN